MDKLRNGHPIDIEALLDPQVTLHPEIIKWRDKLTVDLKLLNSLRDTGQIQDCVFRPKGEQFELIAGARRYFHQKLLGKTWEEIPKKIKELDEREALLIAAAENFFRKDFNKWEEARVIYTLLTVGKIPVKEVAEQLGVKESYIKNRRSLMMLPKKLLERFEKKDIPIGYAKVTMRLSEYPEAQGKLLEEIESGIKNSYSGIRTIERADEFVTNILDKIKKQKDLLEKYGGCPQCESKNISESNWSGDEDKLDCKDCGHSWHKETKEPWKYYELKQKAKELGFEVEEGPDKIKLTPKDVADMVQKEANEQRQQDEEEEEGEKVLENFRSSVSLETILAPLIKENIQKMVIRGSNIDIELIEDPEFYFKGLKKDYKAGEKARIEVQYGWHSMQETAIKVHELIKRVS
uniref:ParB-like N-terminal domain-containing protein n=1 Tax=viral metagenome TaxID=1070528 RepID=A0A6M3MGE8_9ZZZZ